MSERVIGHGTYSYPLHFQMPWWTGFNEARRGEDYYNDYATITARYEYQQGYIVGAA